MGYGVWSMEVGEGKVRAIPHSPIWKRAVAWNRSRRASAYGTVWRDAGKKKTWRDLARNVVVTASF